MKRTCLMLLSLMIFAALPAAAETYSLWMGDGEAEYLSPTTITGAAEYLICDTVANFGGEDFLHGVAVEEYRGVWYATYAYNAQKENTYGEQCFWQMSEDGGQTWSAPLEIKANAWGRSASHGVLFTANDTLYCMLPAVDFLTGEWIITNELHAFVPETKTWRYVSDLAQGFWPNCPPVRMENGNWIVTGGNAKVMISQGDDIAAPWRYVKIKKSLKGSETVCAVSGSRVVALMRPKAATVDVAMGQSDSRFAVITAFSNDCGESFTPAAYSSVLASPSRMFAGTLSDERMYVIFNQSYEQSESRNRLLIGVGEPGEMGISHLYTLAEYTRPISYPYAVERDGKLYVAYSKGIGSGPNRNHNNAVVMIVPIDAIQEEGNQ